MEDDSSPSDMTSGCLTNFIDQSSIDILRSEILNRKKSCPVKSTVLNSKLLTLKRVVPSRKMGGSLITSLKGSPKRTKTDFSLSNDEYEQCRQRMLTKCDLYEKLSASSTPLPDEDNPFLVDFERKHASKSAAFSNAGEMVEFVDKFGRTRQCNRKSLAEFTGMNAPEIYEDGGDEQGRPETSEHVVNPVHDASIDFCNDQYRENLRKKWAKDMETINESMDIHYEHVRFDEVRDLGAAYFSFSRDAKERECQLQRFRDMRKETLMAQERHVVERIQKRSLITERMRRVRANRGLLVSEDPHAVIVQLLTELTTATEEIVALRQEVERQIKEAKEAARKLDARSSVRAQASRGLYELQLERLRDLRDAEFAPPS